MTIEGYANLPRVTIVIINWNYAQYITQAIESVFAQDYPNISCIVADNGSTDDSVSVISSLIAGDSRFRLIELGENIGQLGALFRIFEQIDGTFAVLLDADDILSATFVSQHVQTHLGLPKAVAFTSSNVIEINGKADALTGSFQYFGTPLPWNSPGLMDASRAIRLASMADAQYDRLSSHVSAIAPWQTGWFWSPGSANMYRRSVLAIVCGGRADAPYIRPADAYLNPFCHALGGSALIDLPLSFYRLHSSNYFAVQESLAGVHNGRAQFEAINRQIAEETVDFIFRASNRFRPLLGRDRFWSLPDQVSRTLSGTPLDQSRALPGSVARHLGVMRDALGDSELLDELPRRLRAVTVFPLVAAVARRLPMRFIVRFIKRMTRAFLSRLSRRLRPPGSAPAAPAEPGTPASPDRYDATPPGFRDFGPVAVLSEDPVIVKTGIAYDEWIGIAGAFGRRFGNGPAAFLIYPTWSIEDPAKIAAIGKAAREHEKLCPDHRLVFLGNTQRETDMLTGEGLTAVFLNKNFAVSDTIFRPLPDASIEFDAIYNARFVPEKRYELSEAVESLAYLGYVDGCGERAQTQMSYLEHLMRTRPHHALLNPLVKGLPARLSQADTNQALNRARVGLCLSEVEGTNYASMEYMLAGLGVVSTPSKGGRDVYFDPDYCIVCEPDAQSVRQAVAELKARQIPRDYIRAKTLARIEQDRTRFLELINALRRKLGGVAQPTDKWPFGDFSGLVTWNRFDSHLERLKTSGLTAKFITQTNVMTTIKTADLNEIQIEPSELAPIIGAIRAVPRCRLIVFGCGNDSAFWEDLNRDGQTVFLEDDQAWIEKIRPRLTTATIAKVHYGTRMEDWPAMIEAGDSLMLDLPDGIRTASWDVVLVDGPEGYAAHLPGRARSIFTASRLVAPGGTVFVHDSERPLEKAFTARYLGEDRRSVSVWGRALLSGYSF